MIYLALLFLTAIIIAFVDNLFDVEIKSTFHYIAVKIKDCLAGAIMLWLAWRFLGKL